MRPSSPKPTQPLDDENDFGGPTGSSDTPLGVLEAAREYLARGWRPIPIPFRTKAPTLKGWPDLRLTEADLPRSLSGPSNVGVLLGAPSGNLVDVDLDCDEAVALAATFLPETGSRFGRASKRGSHWLYLSEIPTEKYKDVGDDKSMLVEIRGTAAQTVVPPSVHPTGEPIEWELDGDPGTVTADELRRSVTMLAVTALLSRHWPKTSGTRDDIAMAAAGLLLRAGLPEDLVDRVTECAARVAGDEDSKDRRKAKGTAEALAAGKRVTGGTRLGELLTGDGPRVVEQIQRWLPSLAPTDPNDWPAPQPLPTALSPVPAFNADLLPTAFAPWVNDIAERAQCPPDFVAVGALVAAASVIGRQVTIRPKGRDDWTVVPNLWALCIGRPGIMKSPALKEATRPLERLAIEAREAFEAQQQRSKFEEEKAKARRRILEKKIRVALESGDDVDALRAEFDAMQETEPAERRYVVNDATVEKLGETLNENPNGVLGFRDEQSGWLAMLEREGHENDRAFYCEAWNGDGSYVYDRIGRGTIYIKAACVSMLGGIQPGPLQAHLQEVFGRGTTDDGLIQRFQLMVYPDIVGAWTNFDRWPSTEAKNRVFQIFRQLAELDIVLLGAVQGEGLPYLRFTAEAQDVFNGWRGELERRLRTSDDHPVIQSHLAKYRSLMPSLALLFHVIDCVEQRTGGFVSEQAARKAVAWCAYLEAHARRVYQSITAASATAASALAAKIAAGQLTSPFRARTVYQKGWAGLSEMVQIDRALDFLEELRWVRRMEAPSTVRGGRPTVEYLVNPSVVTGPPSPPEGFEGFGGGSLGEYPSARAGARLRENISSSSWNSEKKDIPSGINPQNPQNSVRKRSVSKEEQAAMVRKARAKRGRDDARKARR